MSLCSPLPVRDRTQTGGIMKLRGDIHTMHSEHPCLWAILVVLEENNCV